MAKLTAWLVTLVGILLVLPLLGVAGLEKISSWILALGVLVIGISKLMRNYQKRKK